MQSSKLRNMTAIYLLRNSKVLLLYREGGSVVNNVWTGSAGGHFEKHELNDPKACVLREMQEELGLTSKAKLLFLCGIKKSCRWKSCFE